VSSVVVSFQHRVIARNFAVFVIFICSLLRVVTLGSHAHVCVVATSQLERESSSDQPGTIKKSRIYESCSGTGWSPELSWKKGCKMVVVAAAAVLSPLSLRHHFSL